MDQSTRTAYDQARNFDSKKFRSGCYAPYVSLYFTTFGDVLACCKNQTFVLGNVKEERLIDIWNGAKIRQLRTALADYRFEAGCELCEWQIAAGDYKSSFPLLFEDFDVSSNAPAWPAMIEFAGSNACNFECIMCCGELSSSIRAHRDGLPPIPKIYSEQFFQDLAEFLPHLQRAKFLGGEPFLAGECLRIWDMIMDRHLVFPCHVTTNGSQYNSKVERILSMLPISLTVSLDGATKQTYESIRINSNFEEVMKNIQRFREYTKGKGTYFSFAFCLMRQNWHEFLDVLLLGDRMDCDVYVNTVVNPTYCSIYELPPEEILRIVQEIENQTVHVDLKRNQHVLIDQLNRLKANATSTEVAAVREDYSHGRDEQHMKRAWQLAEQKLFSEALEEAQKAHPKNSYFGLAYCADIKRLAGNLREAEEDLNRAVQISGRRPEAFIFRGKLRIDQRRFDDAMADVNQARALLRDGDSFEEDLDEIIRLVSENRHTNPQ